MLEEFDDYQREEQQRGVLEAELAPGETLIWQGAPRGRIRVRGTWLVRLCGIIWLACWLSAALPLLAAVVFLGELMGLVFLLFTLPWGALGLWMAYLNPARQRARIESSVYAVTEQRAMIVTTRPDRVVRSLPLGAVRALKKRMGGDGRGELYFDAPRASYDGPRRRELFVFYGIDADAAQSAVQQQMAELRKEGDGNGA